MVLEPHRRTATFYFGTSTTVVGLLLWNVLSSDGYGIDDDTFERKKNTNAERESRIPIDPQSLNTSACLRILPQENIEN